MKYDMEDMICSKSRLSSSCRVAGLKQLSDHRYIPAETKGMGSTMDKPQAMHSHAAPQRVPPDQASLQTCPLSCLGHARMPT